MNDNTFSRIILMAVGEDHMYLGPNRTIVRTPLEAEYAINLDSSVQWLWEQATNYNEHHTAKLWTFVRVCVEVKEFTIDIWPFVNEHVKQEALARLSTKEKQVLGLLPKGKGA